MPVPNDTHLKREAARKRGYRSHREDGEITPSERAQERYPLADYPCERCADPKQGLPHLVDNGSEFYWHHQHEAASWRSGCPRFGDSKHCGNYPRPGTATSLFKTMLNANYHKINPPRDEDEYLKAQEAVEKHGADDCDKRNKIR